ncbi:MAG: hypothetical protein FJ030_16565 [Chloroflexi bacterium]|nr:hypothetical protein [Chloroflexota bacterium]
METEKDDRQQRRSNDHHIVIAIGVALVAAMCLGCAALAVSSQSWLPRAPFGFVMMACVSAPPGRMEVSLIPPFISSVAPLPSAGCAMIPWLPILPQGMLRFRFPP